MMLPIKYQANWGTSNIESINLMIAKIQNRLTVSIPKEIIAYVLLNKLENLFKLAISREGPYRIKTVHDNGTVTTSKGIVVTGNIRRLQPYIKHTDDKWIYSPPRPPFFNFKLLTNGNKETTTVP